jgi:uncharacterized protein (DUF488 family)
VRIPKLFTIGYQQTSVSELVEVLQGAGVTRVVDVRDLPQSRRRGFSKAALSEALTGAGIRYEHVRALGNPKPLRDLFKSGAIDAGAIAYRAHLHHGSRRALEALADSLTGEVTCLLCFERAHEECHRAIIAGAVAERLPRLAVVHL